MTASLSIPRKAAPFCLLSSNPHEPIWPKISLGVTRKLCAIKRYFDRIIAVCDILSDQTINSKRGICSSVYLLRFHRSLARRLRNQIRTTCKDTWLWKTDTWFISSLILHNTISIIVTIERNLLHVFAEKIFLMTSSTDHGPRRHVNTTENAMSPPLLQISSYQIDLIC